ncbi:MAG: tagaturonate epimerase family protein [Trueperaceae bacterium]|nr:tagaturonate epimerase family protein [Trueperaceae bacterium]
MSHPDLIERARALVPDLHPTSLRLSDDVVAWLEPDPAAPDRDRLGLLARPDARAWQRLEGVVEDAVEELRIGHGPLSHGNAALLRTQFPDLAPQPLGLATSAGFGDRLGLATPGHARALRQADPEGRIRPIFAQQSIREMTRTGRSPREVVTDATWGAFAAGWTAGVGGDADHLKTEEDVRRCASAGFAMFTFDPGDRVDDAAATASSAELDAKLDALPWEALGTHRAELRRRYVGQALDAGGLSLRLDDETLARAAAKYGAALAHAAELHRVLRETGARYEIEVSVDETGTPTTLEEHAFLALELQRLELPVVSLAPRFTGRFEKGVDFRGDLDELARTLDAHARIARAFGPYKLSLHSGSDKFSVYPLIAEATGGLVHLKTAGTSYLEALRVAAQHDPQLFRDVLALAQERFETDRASYLIGADPSRVPAPDRLADADLPGLLDDDDARQILHVTFGSALDAFRPRLIALLESRREAHEEALERHFVRHLQPFVPHAATATQGGSS